jgi:REP element-mobilizing transposase RayT
MLAFHGIITAYGFWLPIDPRGSWSDFVAAWEHYRAGGKATKSSTTRSVAHATHDRRQRLAVKVVLLRQPVSFTGVQAREIARGFARAVHRSSHKILACAVLPEHVHVVIAASRLKPSKILGHLKREAGLGLKVAGMHPFQEEFECTGRLPTCWAEGGWKVFLDTAEDVCRAIRYVEENPLKEGKPYQRWSFVTPFTHGIGMMPANR